METITFARFGTVRTLEVIAESTATGNPVVELDGCLTAVSSIEIEVATILLSERKS